MPMPSVKKGETKAKFISRFMADSDMIGEYSDESQRYAVAVSQWKKRLKTNVQQRTLHTAAAEPSALVHTDTLHGKEYTVIPYVLINEGVHNGMLFPAEELENSALLWNGMPVVAPHPYDDAGNPISAKENTDVLERLQVGMLWNVAYEPNKLKGEVWVDPDMLEKHEDGKAIQDMIAVGKMIEGSIGAFTYDVLAEGVWEDEPYQGICYEPRPDHFAMLPKAIGACSVQDGGGGPRIHSADGTKEENGMFRRLMDMVKGTFRKNDTSMNEIERQIRDLLRERSQDDGFIWVVDVFPQEAYCIYEVEKGDNLGLFRQGYSIQDGMAVLVGDAVEVRKEVNYVELKETGEITMTIDELIAHEQTRFSEDDREFLKGLDAKQLEKLAPVAPKAPETPKTPTVEAQKPFDMKELQEAVKDTVLSTLKAERASDEATKAEKVREELKANEQCKLDEESLKELSLAALTRVRDSLEPGDYSGQGGPRNMRSEEIPAPAPCLLAKKDNKED